MHAEPDHPLPVVRVGEIPEEDTSQRWLVEQLWGDSSVGVIGGAPKCSKTWLGLDLALSVATGTACLGKYAVPRAGPVLVYLAEDALTVVRERVTEFCSRKDFFLGEEREHLLLEAMLSVVLLAGNDLQMRGFCVGRDQFQIHRWRSCCCAVFAGQQ